MTIKTTMSADTSVCAVIAAGESQNPGNNGVAGRDGFDTCMNDGKRMHTHTD